MVQQDRWGNRSHKKCWIIWHSDGVLGHCNSSLIARSKKQDADSVKTRRIVDGVLDIFGKPVPGHVCLPDACNARSLAKGPYCKRHPDLIS